MRADDSSFSKRSIAEKMDRILDMFPMSRSRELLPSKASDSETVEDKWEQLQYYESEEWNRRSPSPPRSVGRSSSSSSVSSSSLNSNGKFGFLKNLKRAVRNPFSSKGGYKQAPTSEVNMSPNGLSSSSGLPPPDSLPSSATNKIRSAKSLQNLNTITLNGIHSLREATSVLRNKCNSKIELNSQKNNYDLFFNSEEDELENFRKQERVLMGVGLL